MLRLYQGECFTLVQAFHVAIGQLAKRGAGAIEQGFPAEFVGPLLEPILGDGFGFVVMEAVSHAVSVEPTARLVHGVAVLDAVDGDGHFNPFQNGAVGLPIVVYCQLSCIRGEDGIHRAVSGRGYRDARRLARPAISRADPVRRHAHRLRCNLSAPCDRYAEAIILRTCMTRAFAVTLNALSLYSVALVLAASCAAQLLLRELPCPLCLLQRIQFAVLAIGPILNIRWGPRPSHYAVSLLAACAGAAFSTRQVLLHIMPGDAGYGTALFGYHYYTLALIGFVTAIVLLPAIFLFHLQFDHGAAAPHLAPAAVSPTAP